MKRKFLVFLISCFSFIGTINAAEAFHEGDIIKGRTSTNPRRAYKVCTDGNCLDRSLYLHKITEGTFQNSNRSEDDLIRGGDTTRIVCLDAGLQGMATNGNTDLIVKKVFTYDSPLLLDRMFLYIMNANRSDAQGGNYSYYSRVVAARALQSVSVYYSNFNVLKGSSYFDAEEVDMQAYANMAALWLTVDSKEDPSFYKFVNEIFGPLDTYNNDNYIDTDHDGKVDLQDIENHLVGWRVRDDNAKFAGSTTRTNVAIDVSPQSNTGPNHITLQDYDGQKIIDDARFLFKSAIIYSMDPARVETNHSYVTSSYSVIRPETTITIDDSTAEKNVISLREMFGKAGKKYIDLASCKGKDLLEFQIVFHNLGENNDRPVYIYQHIDDQQFDFEGPLYISLTNDGKNLKIVDSFDDLRDYIKANETVMYVEDSKSEEHVSKITFYRNLRRKRTVVLPGMVISSATIEYYMDNNLGEAALLVNSRDGEENYDPLVNQRFIIGNYDHVYGGNKPVKPEIPTDALYSPPSNPIPSVEEEKDKSKITAEVTYKCEKHTCEITTDSNGKKKYYGEHGVPVDESTYNRECFVCSRPSKTDDNYRGIDGRIISIAQWEKECKCITTGKYLYDDDGILKAVRKTYYSYENQLHELDETEVYRYPEGHVKAGEIIPDDELKSIRYDINKQCNECLTPSESNDGLWHDDEGQPTDEATYKKQCTSCEDMITNKSDPIKDPNFKNYLKQCCRTNHNNDGSSNIEKKSVIRKCDAAKAANDQKGIEKWCELSKYCSICDGTKSVPRACTEFSDTNLVNCANNADAVIKDSDKVKTCIIDYVDENNNSYQYTQGGTNKDNPYCKIYCKEDYKFGLPTGKWTESGKKFTITVDMSGTKSCYTDKINTEQFIADINYLESQIMAGDISSTDIARRYDTAVKYYNYCTEPKGNWENKMDFSNQDIYVKYDENYVGLVNSDDKTGTIKLSLLDSTNKQYDSKFWYCTGNDVNEGYNECINGSSYTNASNIPNKINIKYDCSGNNCTLRDGVKVPYLSLNKVTYASSKSTQTGTYAPPVTFATKALSGTIELWDKVQKECSNKETGCNYERLSSAITVATGNLVEDDGTGNYKVVTDKVGDLPVQLNRTKGAYKFEVLFKGIGQYFNEYSGATKTYGRLLGDQSAVQLISNNNPFEGNYYCAYVVNCPNCGYKCVPNPEKGLTCSTEPTCNGGKCSTSCYPNCIYDSSNSNLENNNRGFNFSARQYSDNNINPNDRQLGSNLSNSKGQKFISEVTKSAGTKVEYEITLNQELINVIRDYNQKQQANGGYANTNMTCTSVSSDSNKEYTYMKCSSNFLKQLMNDEKFSRYIKVSAVSGAYTEPVDPKNNIGPAYR